EFGGPTRPRLLGAAGYCQRVGLHVAGNDAARGDVGAIANLDGGDEGRVRADESTLADVDEMLVEAVIVTKDGAGPDVGARAHPPVADIGKVVGLGTSLEAGVFDLNEIADVDVGADVGARPQPREGPDPGSLPDAGAHNVAIGQNLGTVGNDDAGPEVHIGFDGDVAADGGVIAEPNRFRRDHGHALAHGAGPGARLENGFRHGQLFARIDAHRLLRRTDDGQRHEARAAGMGNGIGQVVFLGGIVVADTPDEVDEGGDTEGHGARIAQALGTLGRGRLLVLTDGGDAPTGIEDQAAVARRVV